MGYQCWSAPTGGPILSSPALDARAARIYAASEDMHVHAFDADNGRRLWRSEKLPGASLRGYHPVVAPGGAVIVTAQPVVPLDAFERVLLVVAKEVFGDFASWRHTKQENARLRRENFALMDDPATYTRQIESLRRRLGAQRAYQTFFVLDAETGKQRFVAPVVYAESMNRFHYLPTHEINAGAALIAYRHVETGEPLQRAELPTVELTADERRRIEDLPWDWDTLEAPRLRHVLESLPVKVPGTRRAPLTEEAREAVSKLPDAAFDRILWEARRVRSPRVPASFRLREKLASAVMELIETAWRPLVLPAGKHPSEAYRVFNDPSETLLTLALAYPHLDAELQERLRDHIGLLTAAGGPLADPMAPRAYDRGAGTVRSLYDPPPDDLVRVVDLPMRSCLERLYPFWLWAQATGDDSRLRASWPALRGLLREAPSRVDIDCGAGRIAGLIAYARLAKRFGDAAAAEEGSRAARQALRERLVYELAHTRGGLIREAPVGRSLVDSRQSTVDSQQSTVQRRKGALSGSRPT